MSYTIEKKEGQVTIDIKVTWENAKKEFDKLVKDASKNVSVKGFRKGKVPTDVAEKQVDKTMILSRTAEQMLSAEYAEVSKKENLKIVGQPEVEMKKLAEGNDIEATLKITLMPEVELPKDWKKVVAKINKDFSAKKIEVTKKDVEEELKKIAQSRAEHKEVKRAAKKEDHVKVDFTVKREGVIIENGTSTDHSLVLGKGVFIPGFEEEVIGMKAGDERSFSLNFPEEYHAKHLAGKEATFDVVLKVVEERVTPEINDEFAKSLGDKFKTLEDFKKNLEEGMLKEKKRTSEEERNNQYLDSIIEKTEITLPEQLVKSELERMIGEFSQQISMSGMTFEDYLAKVGKERTDFEKEWQPDAEKRVKSAMILEELNKELEIKIPSTEIEEELNKTLAQYKGVKDMEKNIDMQQLYEITKGILSNKKAFEVLGEIK
ncbi:MAG: trigger factor [Candidatus Moranbacteria bacterium]|nr:trigger factor [Candidatus Moranbacteria bacterium]